MKLARYGLVLAPVVGLYVAVGWNHSGSALFAPVKMIRSVEDSSTDDSTHWREVENWNIGMSIRQHPLMGLGLGGEYTEYMRNGSIAAFYPQYRAWPHNSVLGLLLLAGVFGFTAIWSLFALVVYLAARSYRRATVPEHRVAALACIASVIGCMSIAYGDTGANLFQFRLFAALSLAVAAKLAIATGAWPRRRRGQPARARGAATVV